METLHEYLDKVFEVRNNVSDDDIKAAKKEYRKLYLKAYRKDRVNSHSRIQASVTKEEKAKYQSMATEKGIKLSDLIKLSLSVSSSTGVTSSNREACLLSLKLRDKIEHYQYQKNTTELNDAITLTNQLIVVTKNGN